MAVSIFELKVIHNVQNTLTWKNEGHVFGNSYMYMYSVQLKFSSFQFTFQFTLVTESVPQFIISKSIPESEIFLSFPLFSFLCFPFLFILEITKYLNKIIK